MSTSQVKLSYNSAALRVRIEFVASDVLSLAAPPEDLLTRALAKLKAEAEIGRIGGYWLHDKVFKAYWQEVAKYCNEKKIPPLTPFQFSLAEGYPAEVAMSIVKDEKREDAVVFSCDGKCTLESKWRFDWFRAWFSVEFEKIFPGKLPHPAQLSGLWLTLMHGQGAKGVSISCKGKGDAAKPYSIAFNRARAEVVLVVNKHELLIANQSAVEIMNRAAEATLKLKKAGNPNLSFHKDMLIAVFKNARIGPERYGLNMPFVALVASTAKNDNTALTPTQTKQQPLVDGTEKLDPRHGLLNITVSADQMEATVGTWDLANYENENLKLDQDWIRAEIKRAGLQYGVGEHLIAKLVEQLNLKADVSGMLIAQGEAGSGGQGPFLFPSYQHTVSDQLGKMVDIREMQQRTIVNEGQLVAELKFKAEKQLGTDVLGTKVKPPEDDEPVINVGEGIEQRGKNKFYAMHAGIPVIADLSISLNRILIHEGDVNLRTGNIRFDGPVEVKGSIDSGALLDITGDLIVHGSIRDAFVRCGGNLQVNSGINTGDVTGLVRVKGDVTAEFIENSRVICGGNVTTKRLILNSEVVCGGSIQCDTKTGVIAGGSLSARQFLRTAKLGLSKGARTIVNIGIDWRAEMSVKIRQGRVEKIEKILNDARQAMRELMRKNKAQTTKKHEERLEDYKVRLQKGKDLQQKMQNHLDAARALIVYEPEARIYVHEILSSNVQIQLAGVSIPVGGKDIAGVEIVPKKRRGTFFQALEEGENKEAAEGSSDDKDKQAS